MKILKRIIKSLIEILFFIPLNFILSFTDKIIKKNNNYWIFPTYFIGEANFSDNMLAVFEQVKNDENIKKIILKKNKEIEVDGTNVEIVPIKSLRAVYYLLKSNVIFVQHSIWLDLKDALFQIKNPLNRKIINLWHGIPMKDLSHNNTGIINERSIEEMPNYFVITSSEIDLKNMQKAFYLVPKEYFWITGLPRNDFLLMDENKLPDIYKKELQLIRNKTENKKLYIYAPTYREIKVGGKHYNFKKEELDKLEKFLVSKNIVLGIRYHPYLSPSDYSSLIERRHIIDVSGSVISDVRMLIREAEVIITDYSSLFIDALYAGKTCVSFAYDYEHYKKVQRGFLYDFEEYFPGRICYSFDELLDVLQKQDFIDKEIEKRIELSQKTFFKYFDANNSKRVIEKVKEIL